MWTSHGKNINISDVDGDWHLCACPYDGWPTVSSELWIHALLAAATGFMFSEVSETMVFHVTDSPARRTSVSDGCYVRYTGFTIRSYM